MSPLLSRHDLVTLLLVTSGCTNVYNAVCNEWPQARNIFTCDYGRIMVSWRGGEQGRGRPGFRLILGNASLCSLELGLYTASGHGDGAAASEDVDGSPQSGGRGKITSAISSNSSRSWLQMEYEDRSLVLLLLHCGQKRAATVSVRS